MENSENSVIDLASLDARAAADAGAELELVHPVSRAGLGVFLTLEGADSGHWREAMLRAVEKRKDRRPSPEEARAQGIDVLASCTIAWRNVHLDGCNLPCTRENARALYGRFEWIREQAEAFCYDRGNFLRD